MMALDVIHEVGPGGSYLETLHTLNHFDKVWYPRIFDRRTHSSWVDAGKPTAIKTANEIAREAISKHEVSPLPTSTLETLNDIISEAGSRASHTKDK